MKLTIFTPTYNRAHTLPRLYRSLTEQTDSRFEWLICDDGSIDNTDEVVNEFINKENSFEIKYIKQKHGGKHRAQNNAIRYAEGSYFITCDSNKYLERDVVEFILKRFGEIKNKKDICGIGGYRADFDGNIYGGNMNAQGEFIECSNVKRKYYNLEGDKATAFYTEIIKKYPFPQFDNEFFVSESAWLTPMAMDGYIIRWFPKVLVYGEYSEDGLTKQGANSYRGHFNNFYGFLYVLALEIQAYGLENKFPELYEALMIAKEKQIPHKVLAKKLGVSQSQLLGLKVRRKLGIIKRSMQRK